MGDRPVQEPTELVIGGAIALLGIVLGAGFAFALWSALHHTDERAILSGAVGALGVGLVLVGLATSRFTTRLFLVVLGLVFAASFFLGGPAFATLSP